MPTTTDTGFTLTQATIIGRQAVKFAVIGIVVLIVGRTLLTAAINFYVAMNPPPPPPPTVGFGILPAITFPATSQASSVTSYRLETPTGRLPAFGDRAKVFLMTKTRLGLLSDQKAKQIAAQYDFVFAPEVLDSTTYRWTKSQPLESTLQIDLNTFYLTMSTDYLSRPELLSRGELPSQVEAVSRVKAMLGAGGLLPADTATASADVTYLKALGGDLQPAVSFSDADYIEVDITRTPIDLKYRMYTPEGYKGTIHAIVAKGLQQNESIVKLELHHQEADYTQVHTYPLRPVDTAWRMLQAGQGYVVSSGGAATATIRTVSMGYYDSFDQQSYLQPIYVFEGDGGFLAYVPALDQTYIQKAQQ